MKSLLLTITAVFGMTALTKAQNVPYYLPTNGLVGWWPFNGNANDESGNVNNGTVNGAVVTSDRFNSSNSAFNFSGTQSSISFGSLFVFNQSSDASISIWINRNTFINQQGTYLYSTLSNIDANRFNFYLHDFNNRIDLDYRNPVTLRQLNISNNFANNSWQHVVYTRIGNTYNLFINGQYINSVTDVNPNLPTSVGWTLGADPTSASLFDFVGTLDDIGQWNRALTQQEITDLYNAVNCNNNTTITPQTNSLTTGSTAIFSTSTSDPNPSYVWQSDFGQGYVTLNNYGNYSGTNTVTLNLSNVQLSEHNQPIRVITTSGNCIDTSNVAIISIADTCINTITDTTLITVTDTLLINSTITGLNPPNNANTIKVFPNPTNDHITIDYGNFNVMNGYQLKIENSLGQQVFQTSITQQSDYLNLTTWGGNGLYFVHIIDVLRRKICG